MRCVFDIKVTLEEGIMYIKIMLVTNNNEGSHIQTSAVSTTICVITTGHMGAQLKVLLDLKRRLHQLFQLMEI